jgi:hypothetical protein
MYLASFNYQLLTFCICKDWVLLMVNAAVIVIVLFSCKD